MKWTDAYTCGWRVFRVNRETWADSEQVGRFRDLKISSEISRDTIQTGSMTIIVPPSEPVAEEYLRVVMTASGPGGSERVEMCTMLWSGASETMERGMVTRSLNGNSVLYPAGRTKVPDLYYAPAGVDGAEFAASMLRDAIAAPVIVMASFTLDAPLYFPLDASVLSCVRSLLDAGSCTMAIAGDGTVTIAPKMTDATVTIDGTRKGVLLPSVGRSRNLSDVHNRYRAVSGTQEAVAVNDDPDSPTSTVVRGYYDDEVDRSPTLVNGETLQAYARRRLMEQSVVTQTRTYSRLYDPDIAPGMMVRLVIPGEGTSSDARIIRQMVNCGSGGVTVDEEAEVEERLWLG